MMIIKKLIKQNFKICYLLTGFFFFNCSQQKNVPPKINCKVCPVTLSQVSFSDNEKDLTSIELNKFYNDNNDYEIIIYSHLEGSDDYKLQRFFNEKSGVWKQIKIENGVKLESELEITDNDILNQLSVIEQKAFYQFCGICYDCRYYTFLIKKKNLIFKYYSNSEPFLDIDKTENQKLINYIGIYDFFKEK
jgi:hypothetical protein